MFIPSYTRFSTIKLYEDLGTLNLIITNLVRDIVKNILLKGRDVYEQLIYYELRESFTNTVDYGESSDECAMSMFLGDIINALERRIEGKVLINSIIRLLGSDAEKIIGNIISESISKISEIINDHNARSLRKILMGELLGAYTLESDRELKEVLDTLLNLMRYLVNDIGKINIFLKFMNEVLPRNLLTLLVMDPSEAINLRLAVTLLAILELNYINKGEKCVNVSPPQYTIVKEGRDEPTNYKNTTKNILNTIMDLVTGKNESACIALCQSIHQASGLGLTTRDYLQSLTQIEPYFKHCYEELFKRLEGEHKNELLRSLSNHILNQILRDILKHETKRKEENICSLPIKCGEFHEKLVKCVSWRELVSDSNNDLVSGEDVIKKLEKLREELHNYLNQELPLLIYAFASICSGNIVIPHVKVVDVRDDIFIDDIDLLVISIKRGVGMHKLTLIPYLIEVSTRKLRVHVSNVDENGFMFTAYLKRDNYLFRKYKRLLKVNEEFEDVYTLMLIDIVTSNGVSSRLDHLDRVKCIVREHPICLYSPEDDFSNTCLVLADIKGYANPLLFNTLLDIVRDLRSLGYYGIDYGAVSSTFASY